MRCALGLALVGFVASLVLAGSRSAAEESTFSVRFLGREEAAAAIVDESMEPYFSLLQPLEMIAKTGAPFAASDLAGQRDECRKRYREAVRDFSDDEKTAIAAAAQESHDALRAPYPFFAETPWSFVKLDGAVEGGMPFTRGPHVVIPAPIAAQFARARSKGMDALTSQLRQILVHEQCHVLQRAHPALFADLYVNVWGFIRAKGLPSCAWLERFQIVNPDGPDVGWVFPARKGGTTAYWQPLVALADGVARPTMPNDFVVFAVALDKKGASFSPHVPKDAKDGRPETRDLGQIPEFSAAFGQVGENFHPNETFAVLFTWLVAKDHPAGKVPPRDDHPDFDFTKLRAWCRKNLAAAPSQGK